MEIRFAIILTAVVMGAHGGRQQVTDTKETALSVHDGPPIDATTTTTMQGRRFLLEPVDAYVGGKCLDGTPASYYWSPPANGTSTMWVIQLFGGGGCGSKEDCQEWASKYAGPPPLYGKRGTSGGWPEEQDLGLIHDYLGSDCTVNPYFCNAHHVEVPHCTGDRYEGQNTNPGSRDSDEAPWGYWFDGHTNLELIIDDWFQRWPEEAGQIQKVLLFGGSGGGRAVINNCDFLQKRLLEKGASAANVMCHTMTAWKAPNLPSEVEKGAAWDEGPTPYNFWKDGRVKTVRPPTEVDFKNRFIPEECASEHDPYYCDKHINLYYHLQRPVFIAQDLIDTTALSKGGVHQREILEDPNVTAYAVFLGQCALDSLKKFKRERKQSGVWMTSCIGHRKTYSNIRGLRKVDVLADWFFGTGNRRNYATYDDKCDDLGSFLGDLPGLPCNPACQSLDYVDEDATL